jgi:UDP-N-acetyl-D-glucosamine dehydrogenase
MTEAHQLTCLRHKYHSEVEHICETRFRNCTSPEGGAFSVAFQKKALNKAKVLVLGVAYKKDIDDLRESPALNIIELLQKGGAEVSYNAPYLPYVGRGRHYDLKMKSTPLDNLRQFDCVLIVTDHSDYDYRRIVTESQLVVDTRNATGGMISDNIVHC